MNKSNQYRFPLSYRLICSESRLLRVIGYRLHLIRLFFDSHYPEEEAANYHLWRLDNEPGYREWWDRYFSEIEEMALKGRGDS